MSTRPTIFTTHERSAFSPYSPPLSPSIAGPASSNSPQKTRLTPEIVQNLVLQSKEDWRRWEEEHPSDAIQRKRSLREISSSSGSNRSHDAKVEKTAAVVLQSASQDKRSRDLSYRRAIEELDLYCDEKL